MRWRLFIFFGVNNLYRFMFEIMHFLLLNKVYQDQPLPPVKNCKAKKNSFKYFLDEQFEILAWVAVAPAATATVTTAIVTTAAVTTASVTATMAGIFLNYFDYFYYLGSTTFWIAIKQNQLQNCKFFRCYIIFFTWVSLSTAITWEHSWKIKMCQYNFWNIYFFSWILNVEWTISYYLWYIFK